MARATLKRQVATKIQRSRKNVFLRKDFVRLGEYDQVGRALKSLADDGAVVKIGYGLYAKARFNRITGRPMVAAAGGFIEVAQEALNRLGVEWQPGASYTAYQEGSTQIPVNAELVISDRFSRKIGTDGQELRVA